MARRKRRGKNKAERNTNKKQLKFEKRSAKKGVYTVRVFADGAELKGQVIDSKDGFVTIKYKSPNSNQILLRKVLEEQVVVVNPNSVIVSGRVVAAEYYATKIVRKGNKIALITLEGEKIIISSTNVDISALVSVVKEEKEEESDDEEEESDNEDEDEDEDEEDEKKKKKKKAKKDDEDEEEDEDEDDEEEEDSKKKKKKAKKDDDDEDEDEEKDGDDDGDDLFADL